MTTETKHTPGPWKAIRYYSDCVSVVDTDGHEVVSASSRVGPIGSHAGERALIAPEEQAANARLIAAAPDLLEALRAVEEAFVVDHGKLHPAQVEAIRLMDDAIARATGKEA